MWIEERRVQFWIRLFGFAGLYFIRALPCCDEFCREAFVANSQPGEAIVEGKFKIEIHFLIRYFFPGIHVHDF